VEKVQRRGYSSKKNLAAQFDLSKKVVREEKPLKTPGKPARQREKPRGSKKEKLFQRAGGGVGNSG